MYSYSTLTPPRITPCWTLWNSAKPVSGLITSSLTSHSPFECFTMTGAVLSLLRLKIQLCYIPCFLQIMGIISKADYIGKFSSTTYMSFIIYVAVSFVVALVLAHPIRWRKTLMGIAQIFSLDNTFVVNTSCKVARFRKYSTHFSCVRKIIK